MEMVRQVIKERKTKMINRTFALFFFPSKKEIKLIPNTIGKRKKRLCVRLLEVINTTVIAEIFVRVKISYSGVRGLSYAINFRTARAVSHTLLYVHGFRMLLNFVLSAESTKSTKLNRVRKFLRLQYLRKSAEHKAQISKAFILFNDLICALRFTDFVRQCL